MNMKNIKFLFLLVATLAATAFTACQQDWEPGQPDSELSVYFPVDENVAAFASVEPEDNTPEINECFVAYFPVYRQKEFVNTKMEVAIRSRFLNPTEVVYYRDENDKVGITVEEAFTVAESVTFEVGSHVAYLEIKRSEEVKDLKVGAMYQIEVMVKEAIHQGHYGLSRKTFSIGIPETWRDLADDFEDEDLKLGTFTDDFLSMLYGTEPGNRVTVTIEESEARAGVYRMKNLFSQDNAVILIGGIPSDMSFASGDTYIEIDASDPENVHIPYQYVGFGIPGYSEKFYIASGENVQANGKPLDNAKLEDGVIAFPAGTVVIFLDSGAGYLANESGLMRVTLPGISVKDYTMSVTYNGTTTTPDNTETVASFDFYAGDDVDKYRFIIVEGNVPTKTENKVIVDGIPTTTYHFNSYIEDIIAAKRSTDTDTDGWLYFESEELDENGENIKIWLDNSMESSPVYTSWSLTLPKASLYTLFAVPYKQIEEENEEGEMVKKSVPVTEENGDYKVVRTHFYYHPANMNDESEGGVRDLQRPTIKLASIADVLGVMYESYYPSCFFLALDIKTDEYDLITALSWYYAKSADIPADASDEVLADLIKKNGSDISSQISTLKNGGDPMLFSADPDTEYTVVLSVTSIFGKTTYYTVTAKTTPYYFNVAYGAYEFEDGNSKMTIEFTPFYNYNYGLMFYMNWQVEEKGPYAIIREYPMVGIQMDEYNAIYCQGQVNGYRGTFFAYDFPLYKSYDEKNEVFIKDPNSVWGFQSSSTPKYDYDYESMVLHYGEDGVINELASYFRQYVKTAKVVVDPDTDEEKTVWETTYVNSFNPKTTVVRPVGELQMPPVKEEDKDDENGTDEGDNNGAENGEGNGENGEENSNEPNTSSMRPSRASKPAMLQVNKASLQNAVQIQRS